jgi:hypothetical protein
MKPFTILNTALVLHIVGIVTMVGTFLASYIAYGNLWKLLADEKEKAGVLLGIIAKFQKAQAVGGTLIIFGGIVMMIIYHGTPGQLLWFKAKMIVLVLIFVNSAILGKAAVGRINRTFAIDRIQALDYNAEIVIARKKLNVFYSLQFAFFVGIFILSAFKFN